MEELREAARAYYNNGSPELQQLARNFFHSLDLNSDGQVGLHEFVYFLQQSRYHWIPSNFFDELDSNHDGNLDFFEVLTLYYIITTRRVWCRGCSVLLKGLYFTCVSCFDDPYHNNTYDLCATCYGQRKFRHHHNYFLDSYMLLRYKKGNGATYVNQKVSQAYIKELMEVVSLMPVPAPPTIIHNEVPARNDRLEAFDAFEGGLRIGILTGCSIM